MFILKNIEKVYKRINKFLFITIPIVFFKKNIVEDIGKKLNKNYNKKALIYYKTDPLFSKKLINQYSHTNNAEIILMIGVLNKNGYLVDLIDRNATEQEIDKLIKKNKYQIFISNAAGNSAPLHTRIIEKLSKTINIFYAAGPEQYVSNKLVNLRHDNFDRRNNCTSIRRRLIKGSDFEKRLKKINAIIYFGNTFNESSYSKYNIPMFKIIPTTSPKINFNLDILKKKNNKNFIYFAGDGLICKGLDLVLEAFDGLNDLKLDVFCTLNEYDFWDYYKPLLSRNQNITVHGFVDVDSELFNLITEKAAFNIFPSSAEACATSVLTCMRRAVIPIVNYEVGVDIFDFGINIESTEISDLKNLILKLSNIDIYVIRDMGFKTYLSSIKYSQEGYSRYFEIALLKIIYLHYNTKLILE
jgi:hypothetical protein